MHNITKLSSSHYEIRVSFIDDLTGKRRFKKQRLQGSLKEARHIRDELLDKVSSGELAASEPSLPKKPLKDWAVEYLDYKKSHLAESSYLSERINVNTSIEEIGDWLPESITYRTLDKYVRGWGAAGLANSTLKHRLGALKRLIVWSCRQSGIDPSFVTYVKLAAPKKAWVRAGRALSVDEARAVMDYFQLFYPELYPLFYVLLATGQRWGSVTALRWQDICEDWVTFSQSHVRGITKDGNKTGKVVRLPLTPALREIFDLQREVLISTENPNIELGIVFPSEKPWRESSANGYKTSGDNRVPLDNACEDLGIEPLTPHDFRRSFNSLQIEAGIDGSILRSITAHSSAALTDHYYHGSRSAKEHALQTVSNLLK